MKIRQRKQPAFAEASITKAAATAEIATLDASIDILALGATLPNPDPVLRKLGISIRVYRELAEETRIGSYMETRRAGAIGGTWEIRPGKAAADVIENVNAALASINMTRLMEQIHKAVGYGYQPLEIVWKYIGGKMMPENIEAKPAEWFCWDDQRRLRFLTKENPLDGIDLTLPEYSRKFLVAQVGDDYLNPYGTPLYSRVYWYAAFKKGGFKFWTKFVEKFGTPWLFGRYRPGATESERDTLHDALFDMVQDALAVIPEGNTIETLKDVERGEAVDAYLKYLDFCNKEITISILGHTGAGESTPGKMGSENGALEVKSDRVESDRNLIASVINQLIRWIVDLNYGETSEAPLFAFEEEEADQKTIAERDQILCNMGMKPNETYFIERWGMKQEWFTVESPDSSLVGAPLVGARNSVTPAQFSESVGGEPVEPAVASLDPLINRSLDSINHNDTIDMIKTMAQRANSLEELLAMIDSAGLGSAAESTAAGTAFVAADLLGRYDINRETGLLK